MIGIIGGTGLYHLDQLEDISEVECETPFGAPTSPIITGRVGDTKIAFLARHGRNHQYLPTEVNFRANIWALKSQGVRSILAVSAVGSLQEEITPGSLVIPDQYIDFTKGIRKHSFFGNGIVAHISSAELCCPVMRSAVAQSAQQQDIDVYDQGTYVCVEGPRLGTKAESFMFRSFGCRIVGMTAVPEVLLAREAGLCYANLCVVTDYDCWKEDEHVDTMSVIECYMQNIEKVKSLITQFAQTGAPERTCGCAGSLDRAVMSDVEKLSAENKEVLSFLKS